MDASDGVPKTPVRLIIPDSLTNTLEDYRDDEFSRYYDDKELKVWNEIIDESYYVGKRIEYCSKKLMNLNIITALHLSIFFS